METFVPAVPQVPRTRIRFAGWLLVLQLICWFGVIIAGLVNFPPGEFDTWTPTILAGVRGPWILFHLFFALALIIGNSAMALLASELRETPARPLALATLVCALGGTALIIVFVALRFSVMNFSESALGQAPAYQASDPIFTAAGVLTFLATCATAVSLWRIHMTRRTGLVVAVLSAALIVLLFVGFPPFALGLLWLPLGITLLRRRAR